MMINNSYQINNHLSKQKGIALVMALIMLLVITLISVSAVRMSSLDTQIAGNSIFTALVFQGAESAIGRSVSDVDITNLIPAAAARGTKVPVPNTYFTPAETVMGGNTLSMSAEIVYEAKLDAPIQNIVANGSEFEYQVFRVNAQSNLTATAARDNHVAGIAKVIPK